MKRAVYSIILFLISIMFLGVAHTPIHAEDASWVDTGYAEGMKAADSGDVNGAAHVSNVNTNSYSDTVRRTIGPVEGITVSKADMGTPYAQKMLQQSAIAGVTQGVVAIFTSPPASTYAFIQDMGQSLGFIPKSAYAQGVGFSGLSAILPVWKMFRNISYFLLAIFMVVIGFMIMFRKKIDQKTIMTVQNSLPKVVFTLILITFSYAIVGICIDLMYVLMGLVINMFQSTGLLTAEQLGYAQNGDLWHSIFNTTNAFQIPWRIFGVNSTATQWLGTTGAISIGAIIAFAAGGTVLGFLPLILGASSVLVSALLGIGLFLLWIRLLVFFISTYMKIILAIIFGPVQLLTEVLPGSNAFSTWFRGLISNLLIFPATIVIFMLSAIFWNFSTGGTQKIWSPPFTGIVNNTTSIGALVALGLLFMIPSIGKKINEALKSKPGAGGMEGVSSAFSGPAQIGLQVFQFLSSRDQMKNLSETIQKSQKK